MLRCSCYLDLTANLKYTANMVKLGRHIVVYGPTCSGKTMVSNQIAERIRIPHIELDALFWTPQWIKKQLEEFRAEVSTILNANTDGWVCDGNYSRVRDLILPLADTVVWLRPPFRVAFWRLLKRTIIRCWNRELLWGNNRESWRLSFLSRDSLILYLIINWRSSHKKIKHALENIPHKASVIELYSSKEVDSYLASL